MISIIIPAHNEEKYITKTLKHIQNLSYPKDSLEVFVVENGSNDATFAIAKNFECENIKVFSIESKGVSKAKNFGMRQVSEKSDWIIFLDADTALLPNFLKDLEKHLQENKHKKIAVGTTSLKPLENNNLYIKAWMKLYDIGHKYAKASCAIQIMKASLKEKIKFDEELSMGEDTDFIKKCLTHGDFFYFDTDSVFTSTRRFEKVGCIKLSLIWNYSAIMYKFGKKVKYKYKVIR